MKKISSVLSILAFTLLLCGCSKDKETQASYIDKPIDTNLEFWITQRVTLKEMEEKSCTYLPGWMGADEYLDSRYEADTSGSMAVAPDIHVTYLVTGYPDTLDDSAITRIEITDPSITVYGLTLESSETEIRERMDNIADSFSKDDSYFMFNIDNCSFMFSLEKITISVPVTNNSGVIY